MLMARTGHSATLLPSGEVLVAGGGTDLVAGGITTGILLGAAELYDPATDTWKPASSLATARAGNTAILLPSGRVLVAGGSDANGTGLSSAELYDRATNTWSAAASMASVRTGHTATLLPSGLVLVAGGNANGTILFGAELYDPTSDTWSAAGSTVAARAGHTATLLASGQVLVAGGFDTFGALASTELYDPVTNAWSLAGSMATARRQHTATLLSSGKVLVAGGSGNNVSAHLATSTLASAELYDPARNSWSAAGLMSTGRELHTATHLPSGQVLVAGGEQFVAQGPVASADLYDPVSNTWAATDSMAAPRIYATAALRPSGKVLVAGGSSSQISGGVPNVILASAELYDSQTQTAVEYYYAAWNDYFITSFPDEIAALDGGAFGGLWQRTGETFNVWPVSGGFASPTCRFFSVAFAPKSAHFYTPFPAECAIVEANPGWQFEAIAFYLQIPTGYGTGNGFCPQGTVALYRLYNNGMGGASNHRYTTNLATFNTVLAQGWVFEGEANTNVFACVPR
jgi:N-acetylneuraminic acid mutarotase